MGTNERENRYNTLLWDKLKKTQRTSCKYFVKGYRLFDKVRYHGREYFIFGRRKTEFFDIRTLSGEKIKKASISVKKLSFADTRKNYLIERRTV